MPNEEGNSIYLRGEIHVEFWKNCQAHQEQIIEENESLQALNFYVTKH